MNTNDRLLHAISNVRLLQEAKEQIADRKMWLKGSLYSECDLDGLPHPHSGACAIGAIMKARKVSLHQYQNMPKEVIRALKALAAITYSRVGGRGLPAADDIEHVGPAIFRFNDHDSTTHADVLEAFDKAIDAQCKIVREEAKRCEIEPELPL